MEWMPIIGLVALGLTASTVALGIVRLLIHHISTGDNLGANALQDHIRHTAARHRMLEEELKIHVRDSHTFRELVLREMATRPDLQAMRNEIVARLEGLKQDLIGRK